MARGKNAVRAELPDSPVVVIDDEETVYIIGHVSNEPDRDVVIRVSLVAAMLLRDKMQEFIDQAVGPADKED